MSETNEASNVVPSGRAFDSNAHTHGRDSVSPEDQASDEAGRLLVRAEHVDISHTLAEGRWALVRDGVVVGFEARDPTGRFPSDLEAVDVREAPDVAVGWRRVDGVLVPPPVIVPTPPPYREVRKLLLVDRLDAGGLLDAAMQALASDPKAKFRWDAAVSVRSDDAQARALLAAIGADPDEYLAPE